MLVINGNGGPTSDVDQVHVPPCWSVRDDRIHAPMTTARGRLRP